MPFFVAVLNNSCWGTNPQVLNLAQYCRKYSLARKWLKRRQLTNLSFGQHVHFVLSTLTAQSGTEMTDLAVLVCWLYTAAGFLTGYCRLNQLYLIVLVCDWKRVCFLFFFFASIRLVDSQLAISAGSGFTENCN